MYSTSVSALNVTVKNVSAGIMLTMNVFITNVLSYQSVQCMCVRYEELSNVFPMTVFAITVSAMNVSAKNLFDYGYVHCECVKFECAYMNVSYSISSCESNFQWN